MTPETNRMKFGVLVATLMLVTGYPAFAFDAWNVTEPTVKISTHPEQGKWTLIAFWALDCALCEQQKPRLSQFNQRYSQLTVLGVAIDGREEILDIQKRLHEMPVTFDNSVVDYGVFVQQFQETYGQKFIATPTYILITPVGETHAIHTGALNFTELSRIIEKRPSTNLDASILR